jgi:rhomboid protease GluP
MDSDISRINVRSQRQAMDWSLVLVSQGIESTIEQDSEGAGFALLVSTKDFQPALTAIRQYRLENRGWRWRRLLLRPGVLFDWGSLAWVLLICVFYWADATAGLQPAGMVDSTAIAKGQWWRIFTAVWLHGDLGHLATNAIFGMLLTGLAMGRFGAGVALLAAYLAGAGANWFAYLVDSQPHHSLGASGMVMGSLGLLAAQAFWIWRFAKPALRHLLTAAIAGLMLFILLGLAPGTDILAHAGGFVLGATLGAGLSFGRELAQNTKLNRWCGVVFASLVLIPWGLAVLRRS